MINRPVDAVDDLIENVIAVGHHGDVVESVIGVGASRHDPRRLAEVELAARRQRVDGRRAPFVAVEMLQQLERSVPIEMIMPQQEFRARSRFASVTFILIFISFIFHLFVSIRNRISISYSD